MLFLLGEVVLDKTDLEVKTRRWLSQEIFIIVQIIVHAFKWIVRKMMDDKFVLLFD